MKKSFRRLDTMRLEDRITPSAEYLPPSYFLHDPAVLNSSPSREAPLTIARSFLAEHAVDFHASPADLADSIVTSQYADADSGTTHVYLRQTVNGLEVANSEMSVHVAADGRVIAAGGGFVPGLSNSLVESTRVPVSSPAQALSAAEAWIRQSVPPESITAKIEDQVYQATASVSRDVLIASKISLDPITARLMYVPNVAGTATLTWQMVIRTPDGEHWYNLNVADGTGEIVAVSDWVDHAGYSAVPLPNEHPNDGGFFVLADPQLPAASPFGWHDTNGVAGAEFTDTRGNNVDVRLDRDANNSADSTPPRPAGTSALDFSSYSFDATQSPLVLTNQNAAMVNLFTLNNQIHDLHYVYGFTPAAGNFQTSNYGGGGSGNDAVFADAQDGSGTNNANFSTPPDGTAPRMQMFIWTAADPDRDSDLDNGVIIHEYGHGVSNRLTGGPANSDALDAIQSGGMGEGWGDWWGLMFEQRPTDTKNTSIGVGSYLNLSAGGIRVRPYSFNMTTNPLMWDSYGSSGSTAYSITPTTAVHRTGTVWASTLWDMNWLLIDKYGFDSDLSTGWTSTVGPGHAGNKLALRLVMDALKLQPANPSFTQARDAILTADTNLTGGANHLQIWQAFARRGLGEGASDGGSGSTAQIVNNTVVPAGVQTLQIIGHTPAAHSITATQSTNFTLTLTEPISAASLQAADLTVNGIPATSVSYTPGSTTVSFTYAVSPVTTNGLQTMEVAAGAFTRDSDGNPVQAFSSSFRYDPLKLTVTSTSLAATQPPPVTTIDINFNEAVLPASVSTNDLRMTQGYATAFSLLNGNTTIRYTVTGLTAETALTATIPEGLITDIDGNGNAAFSGNYQIDYTSRAFPTLTAVNPLGSQIAKGTATGLVNTSTDADEFTIALETGQSVSAVVSPSGGLRPKVTILTPSSTTLVTLTAGTTGTAIATTPAAVPVSGTYTIRIESSAGTSGTFTLDVLLGAAQETEAINSSTNHTPATAQNINAAVVTQGTAIGSAKRAAVLGSTDLSTDYTATPVTYAFEDIASTGTTVLTNADDATTTINIPFTFNFYSVNYTQVRFSDNGLITFGTSTTSNANSNLSSSPSQAAIAVLWDDLETTSSGVKWQVIGSAGSRRLVIQWENVRYWTSGNTGTFTLRFQAVLFEGSNEIRFNYENLEGAVNSSDEGDSATVGIKAANGTTTPRLLLSQNNTSVYHGTGKSTLISPPAPTKDYYSLNATAGETLSLAVNSLAGGSVGVELFDTNGTSLLANGAGSPTNFTAGIADFVIPATGTYYAAVGGAINVVPYSLTVLHNAVFDAEANNTAATAQALGASESAFGSLTSGNDDWYSVVQPMTSTVLKVETATPGGAGNVLNPTLELYNAAGLTLLASGTVLADGRNETLIATGLTPGATYKIRLSSAASTGDYLVTTFAPLPPSVQSVSINNGAIQRSRIKTLSVTFSDSVALAPGAFELVRGATTLTSNPGGGILVTSGPASTFTLTFDEVPGIEAGSLSDGVWTLTVLAANVTADGQNMSANSVTTDIKRLFGDSNGDGTVNAIDLADFGNAFGATAENPDGLFDFNGDFTINAVDFAEFGNRFGVTL